MKTETRLHLSPVYRNPMYAIVYHTSERYDSSEVELVVEKFFNSKKLAKKWFRKHYPKSKNDFVKPTVVKVSGLVNLQIKKCKE